MRRARARSLLMVVAAVVAAAFGFFTNRWFVNPQVSDQLHEADAVVVFPGGPKADERFDRAVELMRADLAPVLFVATDVKQTDLESAICDGSNYEFPTVCRLSHPRTTFGNARATRTEGAERGWKSVILVTSDDHITRSHMLLERCFDGEIQTAVSVRAEGRARVRRTLHEWGGMAKALVADRC